MSDLFDIETPALGVGVSGTGAEREPGWAKKDWFREWANPDGSINTNRIPVAATRAGLPQTPVRLTEDLEQLIKLVMSESGLKKQESIRYLMATHPLMQRLML